jgi:hypothetical protein
MPRPRTGRVSMSRSTIDAPIEWPISIGGDGSVAAIRSIAT